VYESLSVDTKREHFYSFMTLWEILGRDGDPPYPPTDRAATLNAPSHNEKEALSRPFGCVD
jgi:hypothetical protein